MELKNLLFVTSDMDKSVEFYKNVLGLQVAADFGANKILTGGLCLQTLETYTGFIGTENIVFGGNDSEVYFEEYETREEAMSREWHLKRLTRQEKLALIARFCGKTEAQGAGTDASCREESV